MLRVFPRDPGQRMKDLASCIPAVKRIAVTTAQFGLGLLLAHLSWSVIVLSNKEELTACRLRATELTVQVRYLENDNKRLKYDSVIIPIMTGIAVAGLVFYAATRDRQDAA